jgi:hypothetical protein
MTNDGSKDIEKLFIKEKELVVKTVKRNAVINTPIIECIKPLWTETKKIKDVNININPKNMGRLNK